MAELVILKVRNISHCLHPAETAAALPSAITGQGSFVMLMRGIYFK